MEESNYQNDLSKEELLSKYLDGFYSKIFNLSKYSVTRNHDLESQHRGIDLILSDGLKKFYVDEKAQLDYLNSSLPTFAFEISYLKNNSWHKGWLFDNYKITNIYFLITSIFTSKGNDLKTGVQRIKITGIYRQKLISLLFSRGLNESYLYKIENQIRDKGKHGRFPIKRLNPLNEGFIYFSKNNKNEQPINLVLRLDFLVKNFTGKVLFNL